MNGTEANRGLSIRTLMLMTFGIAMLISIFNFGAVSANMFHTQLVLAFAIPGASIGYDICGNSRGGVIGACLSAIIGTVLLSAVVLLGGFG